MTDPASTDRTPYRTRALIAIALLALGGLLAAGAVGTTAAAESPTPDASVAPAQSANVTEEASAEPAPQEGDLYFEAEADDGRWISYINPRDEYRDPSLGNGSGKLCVTLLNEAGEPIVGESVPNTTVTIPMGEELAWHSEADPFAVDYPLTEHYTRPLDSDQFGTDPDLPQGDGYMDAHCLEWHGLPDDETVEYGEVEIEGEHADEIEPVGYVQTARDTWETDVDPISAAEPYEDVGNWTYRPDGSHGQVVAVLQLEGGDQRADDDEQTRTGSSERNGLSGWVGIGALAVLAALTVAVVTWRRR